MSSVFNTPNMGLPSPIPGQETGPQWASDNFNCFTILDAHDHTPGSGVQITPSAININANLTFNNTNNAVGLRSSRYYAQVSPISASGSDLQCTYVSGVDLYFNDGSGNQIRITQSGSVAGASGTITGLPSGTASAAYAASSGSFIFQQATSTAANLDVGSVAIRYPGSYPTPSGNYIQLQAPTSLASGYSITLPSLPAANNTFMTMSTAGIIGTTLTLDNSTLYITGTTAAIKPQGVTQGLLALRSTGTSAPVGGVAISAGTASYSNNSSTPSTIAACTLTTTGRPIQIFLTGIQNGGKAELRITGTTTDSSATFRLDLASGTVEMNLGVATGTTNNCVNFVPPSVIQYLDIATAGTYTYTLRGYVNTGSSPGTLTASNVQLVAYEI